MRVLYGILLGLAAIGYTIDCRRAIK